MSSIKIYRNVIIAVFLSAFGILHAQEEERGRKLVLDKVEVTSHTDKSLSGFLGSKNALVFFTADAGEKTTTLKVTVNNVVLEATTDLANSTLYWTGHNSSLTREDKLAMQALARGLEHYLRMRPRLLAHEELLLRRVLFWSEAPVGLELPSRILRRPNGREVINPIDQRLSKSIEKEVACYVDDDDGRTYLANPCGLFYYSTCHDADGGGHCFTCFAVQSGCSIASGCPGRCGPGCGDNGVGPYTIDCAEHDSCCRDHGGCVNPWDTECGDEYWEADDDYWLASYGCANGCA